MEPEDLPDLYKIIKKVKEKKAYTDERGTTIWVSVSYLLNHCLYADLKCVNNL